MLERPLFEIPVYDQSEREYGARMEAEGRQHVEALTRAGHSLDVATSLAYERVRASWGDWRFNRIVGCIVIRRHGATVKADLWWTDRRRITRSGRQTHSLQPAGRLFEFGLEGRDTSEDIRARLADAMARASMTSRLKTRFVDRAIFDQVSRYVDWRGLVGLSPSAPPT